MYCDIGRLVSGTAGSTPQ